MTLTILNVIYVLVAIAMIGFILVQRGAGAQAGSGFGAGASGTVFGARGAGNFLTKSTAVLATLFFLLSIGMGMYISRGGLSSGAGDLGVMGGATAPAAGQSDTPAAPSGDVPAAPAVTAPATGDVPAAAAPATPATDVPATAPATTEPADEPEEGAGETPRQ